MWRKFARHRLGLVSLWVFGAIALVCLFADFFAPYSVSSRSPYINMPPQRIHFIDAEGRFHLRPFVYGIEATFDRQRAQRVFVEDRTVTHRLQLLPQRATPTGPGGLQLVGVEDGGALHLLGTDRLGRDFLSRLLFGGRITLGIMLVATLAATLIGTAVGLISGYRGGRFDLVTQRVVEVFQSLPDLPLWMALSAVISPRASASWVLVGISLIFALLRWAEIARQIRGKALALREVDYVTAAGALGGSTPRILFFHLLPGVTTHLIVVATLMMPYFILAESILSFLGLGVKPPMTSWGALLSEAQNVGVLRFTPWLLIAGGLITVTVLCLNFIGDALRDAADPHTSKL